MNAKEMFKSLGYEEQFKGSDIYINRKYGSRIAFDDYNGGTIDVAELCYIPCELLKAINMRCEELDWFEEEKQEIKQETNLEFYYDDLIKEDCSDFGVVNGKIESCAYIQCKKCEFEGGNCHRNRITWLASPYEKTTYNLTKFEKELLQCYPDTNSFKLFNSLNGMKEKGYFKGIDENEAIGDILAKSEVVG